MGVENYFQERAEKLTKEEILDWASLTEKDISIIKKLQGNSTKLLIGPRGSGKSMLMKWAYYGCFEDSKNEVFPIYVNFEKYLHLEPFLHETSNGNVIFIQWVLSKIIIEIIQSLSDLEKYDEKDFGLNVRKYFSIEVDDLQRIVFQLEGGTIPNSSFSEVLDNADLSVGNVLDFIIYIINYTGRKRAILLLDDAAHAFSSSLQKEFFNVVRILKAKEISAKAAVYPGLTSYSPYFNIGHDALYLEAGYSPEEEGYIEFCDKLVKKRLSKEY